MEEVNKVIDFSGIILTTLSKIVTFKDDWLFLSDDFKYQEQILRSRLDFYQEQGRIHGQPGSSTMLKTLTKAEAQLKRVELRLKSLQSLASGSHCCSYLYMWYANLSLVLFPENVEKILRKVNEDIDNILKVLKEEGEICTQLQASDNSQPTVNDIDRLYVPIEKPHLAVMKAIDNLQGPHVILLHGGVGKGKSTLARSMVQHYGKDEVSAGTRIIENGNKNDSTDGKGFDTVVWVSCGSCSQDDIPSKQLEILQDHAPNSFGASPPDEKTSPKPRILKALQEFFREKKILVILDDVSDDRFLYEMWKAITGRKASRDGKGVKILVTSQWANICDKAGLMNDSFHIFMEDPTEDEAMKILASHVKLEGHCIPSDLQDIAKEMIKVTERNPLALACLASNFVYSKKKGDQHAWQDALKGLQTLLENTEEKIVLPVSVTGKHADPRSLCGAINMCIDSLKTGDAKKILFLMYAFKEESAPELVLRVLHASFKRSKSTFSKSRDELDMRELLKIHQQPQQPTSLSLRSLVKLSMKQIKMVSGKEIKSLIDELVHNREQAPESSSGEIKPEDEVDTVELEKARVAVTLCALYFDLHRPSVNEIVTDAMTRASITYSNDGIDDLRRQAIYPILSLLDKPEDEHWKESDISSARQVFLTYICKHELDDKNISHLLDLAAFTSAPLATLKALGQICVIEKVSLLKDNSVNFLQAILHLLDLRTGIPMSLIEAASSALMLVCWKAATDKSTSLVISTPDVLDVLVNLISIPIEYPTLVAENAARALWYLSYGGETNHVDRDTVKLNLMEKMGSLVNLVECLSEHDKPGLQTSAAGALANLASTQDRSIKLRIVNQEGALHSLVKLMSSHETPSNVQEQATRALRNLAAAEDGIVVLRIVNEETAVEGLVNLLSMRDKPKTQAHAAAALGNLASNADSSITLQIANQEGDLHSLVKLGKTDDVDQDTVKLNLLEKMGSLRNIVRCLSEHDNPGLQTSAAGALANLAWTRDQSIKLRIVNEEGALHSLVKLMSSHNTPGNVQEEATRALGNLAAGEDGIVKLRIVNEETAVEGLVNLLSMCDKPKTQADAAAALGNLASIADSSVKLQIANQEGALHSLVKLTLSQETPGHMQEATRAQQHAVGALANLACSADNSVSLRIANEEGLLNSLVKLMSSHKTPGNVQEQAARALRHLAAAEDGIVELQIFNEEKAVEGLVKLLSMHDNPMAQQHAAGALANLACSADSSVSLRIANEEGLINSLVKLMSSHKTPSNVQEEATRALRILAAAEDGIVTLRIVNEETAVEGLVNLLSMRDKPKTQAHAAAALGNLACIANSSVKLQIANQEGALHSLVKLMSSHETPSNVQEEATRALRILAAAEDGIVTLRIVNEEMAVEGLVNLLSMHDKPKTQAHATVALGNLACIADSSVKLRIANQEGALHSLVKLMSSHETPGNVQEEATRALRNLAAAQDDVLKIRIAKEEVAVCGLVKCLAVHDRPVLQQHAGWTFWHLAEFDKVKAILKGTEGLLNGLSSLLADGIAADTQYIGARTLTLINTTLGNEASLTSGKAYSGRADAFISMGMFEEALRDLELAVQALQGADINVLCDRCFVKAKLGDLHGALDDANVAVKLSHNDHRAFALQERGVLKQMLGDLKGGLADLDEAWKLDNEDYEVLKQRGFVRFLLRDEEGARRDAKWALRIKPPRVDRRDYRGCLGVTPVEYLGYKLK